VTEVLRRESKDLRFGPPISVTNFRDTVLSHLPFGQAFTGCGKLHPEGLVTGHDFSRADKANEINRALACILQ
jgi:hypothetical protein